MELSFSFGTSRMAADRLSGGYAAAAASGAGQLAAHPSLLTPKHEPAVAGADIVKMSPGVLQEMMLWLMRHGSSLPSVMILGDQSIGTWFTDG